MSAAWSTKAVFPDMLQSSAPDLLSPRKSLQTHEVQPDAITCFAITCFATEQAPHTKVRLNYSEFSVE